MATENIVDADKIQVGDRLEMQRESNPEHGYFDWGIVEESDISRLRRGIERGNTLWRWKI